ncbi:MAG: FliO/MopB family protein [Rhodospirillaceae bacterium]|jgi:flagellar protein FliO/FliZ|nr:FliO/MopB family protein [Rhodospirillaceae bacterium]MBT5373074.1 FliO/MopB family protein [Rhodospirillaceae bacterium]MBT5658575.1 FliO/MopB family protein [Rhodospirillaceae bacterium]MBT5752792.1 FliO/MopB family protein [Rhodospirillaceae bacterium]
MELESYLKFIVALLFVLALIFLLAHLVKRFGIGFPGNLSTASTKRRLTLIEQMTLDAKRRLVLVRRDDVEHLILLGPSADLIVETGIAGQELDKDINPSAETRSAETRSAETNLKSGTS